MKETRWNLKDFTFSIILTKIIDFQKNLFLETDRASNSLSIGVILAQISWLGNAKYRKAMKPIFAWKKSI
jgi:hypothetical protein